MTQRRLGSDAARAVGRFKPDGPDGYRAKSMPDAPLRGTRKEAEDDERLWLAKWRGYARVKQHGILFSHASESTVPGLVYGEYGTAALATDEAMKTARTGVKFLLVTRENGGEWLAHNGRTPIEALRAGIDSGFRGWRP